MKKSFLWATALLLLAVSPLLLSMKPQPQPAAEKWMMVTTIESVVPGNLGRSRMLITDSEGRSEERDLRNFFSLTGINFKNVASNDQDILLMVSRTVGEGWEIANISTGVQSSSSDVTGIFITRYLFRKRE